MSYIVDFENHFANSKIITLNLNYRSTQNIVGASNEVIKHNKFKVEKDIQASKKSEHKIVVFYKEGVKVQAKTIHAAKGLEAKVVFIIGLTEGNGGFPDIWLEDRIFQVIKKANHDLLMEEERRLFYVAITRAKDKLFLITEKGNESSFLKEIPDIFTVKTSIPIKSVVEKVVTCPKCFSQLEKLFAFCPYCGHKISG
ncbi:MAG: hypothetical protein IPH18_12140 [Chitinophagaceae bacterium]|nr:hypothetical protein [Chitinophagaceae bacterium]